MSTKKLITLAVLFVVILCVGYFSCNFMGNCVLGLDMDKVIRNSSVLTPSTEYAALFYSSFNSVAYWPVTQAFSSFERDESLSILRVFAIVDDRCYFAANLEDHTDASCLGDIMLYCVGIDGKDFRLIGEYNTGDRILHEDDFGDVSIRLDPTYSASALPAYYYNGEIVVNDVSGVFVYDIASGTTAEFAKGEYVYHEPNASIRYDNGEYVFESKGSIFRMSEQDIIALSPEMSFLYELTLKYREGQETYPFIDHAVYYAGELYLVCRPMNKYGISFGALFRYVPETNSFIYIDCRNTNDVPHCVYPVIIH